MTPVDPLIRPEPGAVRLRVRLTPRSSRDRVVGIETLSDGAAVLAVQVRAVPEKGAANLALEKVIAEALGVPRSRVAVVGGSTSRLKTVRVEGDAEALATTIGHIAKAS